MRYYGTRKTLEPPPGYSHRSYRRLVQAGKVPGHKLPGRAGWVVSETEWEEWLRSKAPDDNMDPIEADIRRRFHCTR